MDGMAQLVNKISTSAVPIHVRPTMPTRIARILPHPQLLSQMSICVLVLMAGLVTIVGKISTSAAAVRATTAENVLIPLSLTLLC